MGDVGEKISVSRRLILEELTDEKLRGGRGEKGTRTHRRSDECSSFGLRMTENTRLLESWLKEKKMLEP